MASAAEIWKDKSNGRSSIPFDDLNLEESQTLRKSSEHLLIYSGDPEVKYKGFIKLYREA